MPKNTFATIDAMARHLGIRVITFNEHDLTLFSGHRSPYEELDNKIVGISWDRNKGVKPDVLYTFRNRRSILDSTQKDPLMRGSIVDFKNKAIPLNFGLYSFNGYVFFDEKLFPILPKYEKAVAYHKKFSHIGEYYNCDKRRAFKYFLDETSISIRYRFSKEGLKHMLSSNNDQFKKILKDYDRKTLMLFQSGTRFKRKSHEIFMNVMFPNLRHAIKYYNLLFANAEEHIVSLIDKDEYLKREFRYSRLVMNSLFRYVVLVGMDATKISVLYRKFNNAHRGYDRLVQLLNSGYSVEEILSLDLTTMPEEWYLKVYGE